MPWSRAFEDPVPLPDGRLLRTLRQAADHIQGLPADEQQLAHWHVAIEVLIAAAEDRGPLMHARIGMLRAINHGRPQPAAAPRGKKAKPYRIIR
jgi:hypothetical protein